MPKLLIALAVASVTLAIVAWLVCAARELSHRRNDLGLADKQMAIYCLLRAKARDDPEVQRTCEQVEMSRAIYQNAAAEYNRSIARPKNRLMARLLGYTPAPEVKPE